MSAIKESHECTLLTVVYVTLYLSFGLLYSLLNAFCVELVQANPLFKKISDPFRGHK